MSKLTKNQKVVYAKVDPGKQYKLPEACELIKDTSFTKFDASVDMAVRLGVDPRKANQMVRGVVTLPHGTGKQVRVLVLCTPDKEEEAKTAGADHVGLDEYIEKIKIEYGIDFVIANGENSAGGVGITKPVLDELYSLGIDVVTTGNHIWDKKDVFEFIEDEPYLVRPANYPQTSPGQGFCIYDYQSILELLKWNDKGNFDRVSEMLIHGLQWKLQDVQAAKELVHRKKVTEQNIRDT